MATSNVPLTLEDVADATDNAIQTMWINRASSEAENYTKFFTLETGVRDRLLKESDVSDLGLAGRITENAAVTGESPVQGFDTTYTQVEFGLLLSITKQMWKFGITKRKLEGLVDELKRSIIRKREKMAAAHIVYAQSATYTEEDVSGNYTRTISGGNGVALCSNAQTREDGGTSNNNVIYNGENYNLAAGYNGLKALDRTAALVLSPKGNQLSISPNRVLVKKGSSAAHKFKEILAAIKSGKMPETFSNDGAGVNEFELVELPYLTSATAWHALDTNWMNDRYGLQYKESQPITLEPMNIVYKTGKYLAHLLREKHAQTFLKFRGTLTPALV